MVNHAATASIRDVLAELAAARLPSPGRLVALSALGPQELEAVRSLWPGVSPERRRELLEMATELAIADVHLDFAPLAELGLDDPDASVRVAAIEALWEVEDRAMARRFARLLDDDPDDEVRVAAARALRPFVLRRELGILPQADGDLIVDLLTTVGTDASEATEVRASAIGSLGARSDPSVKRAILDTYYEDDSRLQLASLQAMGDSADEEWLEYLFDAMRSSEPEMRTEAAAAAGMIGSEEALDELLALLDDEDIEVAGAAIGALGEIGGPEAIRSLREFLERAPESLQGQVEAALGVAEEDNEDEEEEEGDW